MRRPIRVVQIISTLSVSDFGGGSELFGIRLAEGLRQAGCEVAIIPLWSHGTSVERDWFRALTRQGIAIHYGAPFRDGVKMRHNITAAFVGSCRHIHNLRPDIVNTHGEYPDLIGMTAPLASRTSLLVRTGHTELDWTTKPQLGHLLHNVFPFVCTAEVGVSRAIVRKLDRYPAARLARRQAYYIHNGVDPEVILAQRTERNMRAVLEIAPHAPLFGTVARLTRQKGLPYLLEAMRQVRTTLPDARLVVVGTGDKLQELQAQVSELGLDDCVRLLGSRTDVADIVASLDVFVLPSLWEGLPTVVLEAMALGTPVVATDIPGTRELVFDGRTGLLAPPRDPAKLADVMVQQYCDRERAQALASAARRHAALFSIQHAAKQYAVLYTQLVRSAGARNEPH